MLHFLASTTWQPWPPISRSASKHTSFPKLQCIQSPEKKPFLKPRKKTPLSTIPISPGEGGRKREMVLLRFSRRGFFFGERKTFLFDNGGREREPKPLFCCCCRVFLTFSPILPSLLRRGEMDLRYIFLRNWRHTF